LHGQYRDAYEKWGERLGTRWAVHGGR